LARGKNALQSCEVNFEDVIAADREAPKPLNKIMKRSLFFFDIFVLLMAMKELC